MSKADALELVADLMNALVKFGRGDQHSTIFGLERGWISVTLLLLAVVIFMMWCMKTFRNWWRGYRHSSRDAPPPPQTGPDV